MAGVEGGGRHRLMARRAGVARVDDVAQRLEPRRAEEVEICTGDAERTMHELLAAGVPLTELRVAAPTLEDVFLKLTGHGLRG